jgi:CubicO group peptidase (beta-lactamase class C family)
MHSPLSVVVFSACAFVSVAVSGPAASAQDRFETIRESIRTKMVQRSVPSIAVAVAEGDKILWEQGFGWANREKRIHADANTMYSLASISKPLTATALMTLVRAGKIDLDQPINDYLGPAKLRARVGDAAEATVRRVANHSAGLPEYYQYFYENEPQRPASPDETILRYGNLFSAPGERFQYSNLGYGVLSYVISRVSGMTFADYMRDEVFLKLGMTRTAVGIDPALREYQAIRYDGEDLVPIAPYQFDHEGASAIYSSAHDLVRFGMFSLKAHLPDQVAILPDSLIDAMQVPTITERPGVGYGVGWEKSEGSGYTLMTHSGGMPGVATWLRLEPSKKIAIVVLCNEDDRLAHTIADEITALMLPHWQIPELAVSKPLTHPVPSAQLVGLWKGNLSTYLKDIPITIEIRASGDVHVQLGDQYKTLLDHAQFSDGLLRGIMNGDVELPEAARRPYTLSVNLKLRNGNVLSGAISARTNGEGTMLAYPYVSLAAGVPDATRIEKNAFVITQWCELSKQ